MSILYRFAEPNDAADLALLHTRAWRAGYQGLMDEDFLDGLDSAAKADKFAQWLSVEAETADRLAWIVAEIDGRPVGHVIAMATTTESGERHGYLGSLYVDPDHWGSGIGGALHDMALRAFAAAGLSEATLEVLENGDALRFYQKRGWTLTGDRTSNALDGVAAHSLTMKRPVELDVLAANRSYWDGRSVENAQWAGRSWDRSHPSLGIFSIDGSAIFPAVNGLDVVELGCGTGYVSGWCLQRGARSVVGIDASLKQLATAKASAAERNASLPLIFGDAERTPLRDDSFDVAISEYGAAIWCDPRIWIPEAARILRPGGQLWFLGSSIQMVLCEPEFEGQPAQASMARPQRGMHRRAWLDTEGVEYHVSHGEMISILTGAGFVIQALHELYAEADMSTPYDFVTAEWASKWPVEEVWVARLS